MDGSHLDGESVGAVVPWWEEVHIPLPSRPIAPSGYCYLDRTPFSPRNEQGGIRYRA